MLPRLTKQSLIERAATFAEAETRHREPSLFGVTDGKAVGTYLEHKFRKALRETHDFEEGSSAKGIDFPGIQVDLKVTSIKQPQSSCPFKSARQKVYGLGYSLIVFVYDKHDDPADKTATLAMRHVVFVDAHRTGDFQLTTGLLKILDNEGNEDDLVAFMMDKNLPLDEIQAMQLATEILGNRPVEGYLTISNALQWRLQYKRVIDKAGEVDGLIKVH